MSKYKEITDERSSDYGTPQENHTRTAMLYTAYLCARFNTLTDITPDDVCYMNILQKMSRDMHGAEKLDTLDDIVGYVENIKEMRGQSDNL